MPPHQPFDDGGGAFIVGEFIPSNRFVIIIPQSLHKRQELRCGPCRKGLRPASNSSNGTALLWLLYYKVCTNGKNCGAAVAAKGFALQAIFEWHSFAVAIVPQNPYGKQWGFRFPLKLFPHGAGLSGSGAPPDLGWRLFLSGCYRGGMPAGRTGRRLPERRQKRRRQSIENSG